ncbi:LuxR C-terminal-related transcriptional regulator [Streptomyces sp. NPDC102282]|uniref:LuxR C-terminal-related transcriptional regulator n=1 Tax=Streptomyces sp. NPDC102282 TaxID=3366154 RepID=UPI0037F48C0D
MEARGAETEHGAEMTGGGFVGRVEEARRLRRALRDGPSVVVVRGEAGTGVSRLVDEVLGGAECAGWTHLRGVCPDVMDPALLGPVADALAGLPHRPVGAPGRALPSVTGVVGLVVPELTDRLPPPPAAAADPEVRRGLLPRAVQRLLTAIGDTVLVVEDLQHADPSTLGLLHHLMAAMPPRLRLVLTEDAAPGLPGVGVRVPARVRVEEVRVQPWVPGETEEFVRQWLDARPGWTEEHGEVAGLVHRLSGGLPGVARALLQEAGDALRRAGGEGAPRTTGDTRTGRAGSAGAAAQSGVRAGGEDGPPAGAVAAAVREAGVPPRVRLEFAQRCVRLDEDAHRIVDAAAVLDRAVPLGVLAEVAGIAPERAGAALDMCVRGAVLRAVGPYPGFRHPLDREAALARIPGPRLAGLSLRAARALRRAGGGPLPLADLARLYRAAGRIRESLRCLVVAADRAATAGDYSTATTLYTQAIVEDPRAAGRVHTAEKLARTAHLARAGEEVVSAVRRVLEEDDPPPRVRGEIRLQLSVVLRNQSGGALDSLNEVAHAIPDLEMSDPQTAARAMAVAAIPSIKGWAIGRHQEWLDRGEALAGQVTDPVARASIAANRATALMLLGDHRAWAAAETLHGPAATAIEAAHHTRGWTNLAHAATALGYDVRAQEFLDRATDGLAETSSPYVEGLTQTARLVLAWHGSRWHGLHEAAGHTARLYREIPDLTAEALLVRGLTALHVLGDVPRARRDLTDATRTTRYDTGVILTASAAAIARVHLEAGRPGQACDAVEETLHRLDRTGGWVWAGEVAPTAVEALVGSGQTAGARRLVADFAAGTADRDAPAARTALTMCQAWLAEAEDQPDEAIRLWADAEAQWVRLGRPFDASRAAEARGRCLLSRHGETAAGAIQEVLEVYRELGARWDVARCQRLLRRHDIVTTHRRGRLGYGDELSPREQEVARLVVQGRANRDIAESLVLSTRTVEHHVARIMRKLNVTSRNDISPVG